VSSGQVLTSIGGFVVFYTALAIVDVWLMLKFTRKGPDGLGIWPHNAAIATAGH
jgi:cytochrome d ubiquinol oxidase subunit I